MLRVSGTLSYAPSLSSLNGPIEKVNFTGGRTIALENEGRCTLVMG